MTSSPQRGRVHRVGSDDVFSSASSPTMEGLGIRGFKNKMAKKFLKIAVLIDQLVPGGVQKYATNEVFHLNQLKHRAKLLVLMRRGYQKKFLKIAVLIDQLVPGGVQKYATNEVFHLNQLKHRAKLLVLMRRGYQKKFLKIFPRIPIIFLSDRYPKIFKNSIKFPIFSFFSTLHLLSPYLAPQTLESENFDIIVAHGTTTCLTALSIWKKHRIPYIAVIYDPMEYILKKVYSNTPLRYVFWILSPLLFYLEGQIVKNAKIVVVISEKHLSFIQKHYQITPEILLAGTIPLFKLPKRKQNYLIASSRWESGKNPQLLLDIMKALPNNKLVVVGNWTNSVDLKSFRHKIKENNLAKRVILKTDISPKQLTKLYSEALVWIHPNIERS